MLQYNVYYVELLAEDNLKGVTVAVILDNKRKITEKQMKDTARLLNTFRTCFITNINKDDFSTRLFSVNGEIHDGFYGSVAAIYALTETMCIREIQEGEKYITINTNGSIDKAAVMYQDSCHVGVRHELDLANIQIVEEMQLEDFQVAVLENTEDSNFKSKIIFTNDGATFSRLRKQKLDTLDINGDYLILYYDRETETAYFNVQRNPENKDEYRINSRHQVAFIIKYLLLNGVKPEELTNLSHILSTGQYVLIHTNLNGDKAEISMDARILLEGIITI